MENPLVSQLQDAVRRIEAELSEIDQARAKKKRELREHRRALDILSGKRRTERKTRHAATGN